MKIETIAIHAGNIMEESNKAVIQPITLSTTFERSADGSFSGSHIYTRISNPNRSSLEKVLTQLENGVDAAAFASGNAAGLSIFQALEVGSHIIAPDDMYHGMRNQLKLVFSNILEFDFIDLTQPDLVQQYIKPNTKLIWIESPSNPLLKITDIAAIAHIGKQHNLTVVCDSTFATPVFQQPLNLGVDIVMHSTTKYLGGHSDVLGGILITKAKTEFWDKVRQIQELSGAVPSPFDCYMTVRGIKTLYYRMQGHQNSSLKIAEFLENHIQIERVYHPGLKSHPQYAIAKKQMNGYSGMLSFCVKGGAEAAKTIVNSVNIFTQATSLGGVESLIEHRASIEGPDTKTPQNLIRVSVGLENSDDLIADLSLALSRL
jgi:cystathionine gamma-synthase